MLIPIGSGSFVKAKLEDPQHVIIGVGAGVCIEKTVDDSIRDLNMRASDMDKARINVTQQLNQISKQSEDNRARLEDIARKKGGRPGENEKKAQSPVLQLLRQHEKKRASR